MTPPSCIPKRSFRLSLLTGLAALCAVGHPAHGQSVWEGNGGNPNWSTVENWSGDTPPSPGGSTVTELIFGGGNSLNTVNNLGTGTTPSYPGLPSFVLRSLSFDASAGAFVLSGDRLTFSGSGLSVANQSAHGQTLRNDLLIEDNVNISFTGAGASRATILSGTITDARAGGGNAMFSIGANTNVIIEGAIVSLQGGAPQANGRKLAISGGRLGIATDDLRGGTLTGGGGALYVLGGDRISNRGLHLESNVTYFEGANDLTLNGGLLIGSGASLSVQEGLTLTITGENPSSGSSGTLTKRGYGTLAFSQAMAQTNSVAISISGGEVRSTVTSGNPFSQGSINLNGNGSILSLTPSGSGGDISLTAATASSGSKVTYYGANTIRLDKGEHNSLTLTLGAEEASGVLVSGITGSSLIIAAGSGMDALGVSEKLIVRDGVGTTNGIVTPSIVGRTTGATQSADFLGYDETNGFVKAAYGDTNFSGATDNTTVSQVDTAQTEIASRSVYALKTSAAISLASGQTLTIGNGTGEAGLILNGGSVAPGAGASGTALAFGTANGLIYVNGDHGTIATEITGTGGINKLGVGTLVLSGDNAYSGDTRISEGAIRFESAISGSSLLRLMGGVYEGSGSFTRSLGGAAGGVTWLVSGIGYDGGFSAHGGTLEVNLGGAGALLTWGTTGNFVRNGNALLFGSETAESLVDFQNAIDLNGATQVIRVIDNPGSATDRARISGVIQNGSLIKQGGGILELTAGNTYAGVTTIQSGTLVAAANDALGTAAGDTIVYGDGALAFQGDVDYTTAESVAVSGAGAGSNGVIRNLDGNNAFAGLVALVDDATITSSSGSLELKGGIDTLGKTLTLDGDGDITVSTTGIGGSGGVVKNGNGTVTLSATHSYSGATLINQGTLLINGDISASSEVSLGAGGVLAGHGTVGAISGSGTVGPGNSPGLLTAAEVDASSGLDFVFEFTQTGMPDWLTPDAAGNDTLRLTSAEPFTFELTAANEIAVHFNVGSLASGDVFYGAFYADTGDLSSSVADADFRYFLNGNALSADLIRFSAIQQSVDFGNGMVNGWIGEFQVVPEPGSTAMMIGGGLLLMLQGVRRNRRDARSGGRSPRITLG